MRSTKTNIAERIGIKLLVDNILSVRFLDFCHAELVPMVIGIHRNDIYSHAELVSASLPYGKDSDLRRNDVYCHAELVSASLPYVKVPTCVGMTGFVVRTRLIASLREPLNNLKLRKLKTKYN